ncbi:hypothetical protein OG21DRAFT_1497436 [Imleria badia]|nr:hypothetical protein OG21DRAFT_1497436 [Imleria badia]
MPKHKTDKMHSSLDALTKTLANIQKELQTLSRKQQAHEHREKNKKSSGHRDKFTQPSDLIPRPEGSAGRGSGKGYSIIAELQLTHKKEYYNYLARLIRELAIKYLDTSRTITRQKSRLAVEKVIREAQMQSKLLRKHVDGWGARALLAQYLRNSSQRAKNNLRLLKGGNPDSKSVKTRKRKRDDAEDAQDSLSDSIGSDSDSEDSYSTTSDNIDGSNSDSDSDIEMDSNTRKKADKAKASDKLNQNLPSVIGANIMLGRTRRHSQGRTIQKTPVNNKTELRKASATGEIKDNGTIRSGKRRRIILHSDSESDGEDAINQGEVASRGYNPSQFNMPLGVKRGPSRTKDKNPTTVKPKLAQYTQTNPDSESMTRTSEMSSSKLFLRAKMKLLAKDIKHHDREKDRPVHDLDTARDSSDTEPVLPGADELSAECPGLFCKRNSTNRLYRTQRCT